MQSDSQQHRHLVPYCIIVSFSLCHRFYCHLSPGALAATLVYDSIRALTKLFQDLIAVLEATAMLQSP